jgi:DNA-binding HxlR family transcriptional regulator
MPMPAHPGLSPECRRVSSIVRLAGDRWTFTVIAALDEGPCRFNELKRVIGGISQQMLTRTLRSLERDGMVERTVFATVPPQVEYALSPLGRQLGAAIRPIGAFAEKNVERIEASRQAFDEEREGEEIRPRRVAANGA